MKTSKVISQSEVLPVNLAVVKSHLGIYHDEKNFIITTIMSAATQIAEKFTGQVLRAGGDVYDQYFDSWPADMQLDYAPVTGVTHVKYFDASDTEQTLATGYYRFIDFCTPQKVEFTGSLPSVKDRADAIRVRYVAGKAYATQVPQAVKEAILLICQYLYDNPGDAVRQMPTASEYILRNYKIR